MRVNAIIHADLAVFFKSAEESSEINELIRRIDELGRELVAKDEQVLYIKHHNRARRLTIAIIPCV